MADKSISELAAASSIGSLDLFVLEQGGTAKKLTGQILENWLVSYADGHGGIQSITKTGTSGLVDTYTITLADETTTTFTVKNGKSITSLTKTGSSGTDPVIDAYRITYNDGTHFDFNVTNGLKGDTGDAWYVWIKYAGKQPTQDSDMGDTPDKFIGIYSGTSSTAPSHYTSYSWYEIKGAKGDTGDAAEIVSHSVAYQAGTSGEIAPSGTWTPNIPTVPQGQFLWSKTTITFNTGNPVTFYSVARMGIDGSGSVSSVNGQSPDGTGNVTVMAEDISTSGNISVEEAIETRVEKLTTGTGRKVYAHTGATQEDLAIDSAPTAGSGNLITSGGVSGMVIEYTATLLVSGWSTGQANYTQQTVTVTGLKSTDKVILDANPSAAVSQWSVRQAIDEQFGLIYIATNNNNSLAVSARSIPTVDIPIKIIAIRN